MTSSLKPSFPEEKMKKKVTRKITILNGEGPDVFD